MKTIIRIEGMHCAACAQRIEKNIKKVSGVSFVNVNLASDKASVEFDEKLTSQNEIERAIDVIVHDRKESSDIVRFAHMMKVAIAEIEKEIDRTV